MSVFHSTCERILKDLGSERCSMLYNVNLTGTGFRGFKRTLPAVIVTDSAVVAFVKFDSYNEEASEQLKREFRPVVHILLEKLDIGMHNLIMCGFISSDSEVDASESFCIFNIYNEKILYFPCEEKSEYFVHTLLGDISYSRSPFEADRQDQIKLKLDFMTGSNGTVKSDSEGNMYIKKHGHWFLASDWDPDELFQKAVFGGSFGAHKFADDKKLIGLLYFFTCGFFGIGWIFDCLEIIFGKYKDSQGKYVLPVSDRKSCLLKMFGGFVITAAYMFTYLFFAQFFGNLLNRLAETFISNQDGDLENIFGGPVEALIFRSTGLIFIFDI